MIQQLAQEGSMLTVLSYGCGQDSHTLLLKYIHDGAFRAAYAPHHFVVVMSDTGDEHPHTYSYLEDVTRHLCNRCDIPFVLITPDMGFHTPAWQSLRQAYTSKSMIGSPAFGKVCTDKLKIVPIYKYIDDEVEMALGAPLGDNLVRIVKDYWTRVSAGTNQKDLSHEYPCPECAIEKLTREAEGLCLTALKELHSLTKEQDPVEVGCYCIDPGTGDGEIRCGWCLAKDILGP